MKIIYLIRHPNFDRQNPNPKEHWAFVGYTGREKEIRWAEHIDNMRNNGNATPLLRRELKKLLDAGRDAQGSILETLPNDCNYSEHCRHEADWIVQLTCEGHNVVNTGGLEMKMALDMFAEIVGKLLCELMGLDQLKSSDNPESVLGRVTNTLAVWNQRATLLDELCQTQDKWDYLSTIIENLAFQHRNCRYDCYGPS